MVVVTIAAVLLTMGAPELAEFLAEQRVRTMTSDLASEISFARAKAVETSRRVYMEKTGVSWLNGWRIYADLNDNGTYDAGEELKTTEAVPHGTMYTCSTVADFATNIIFRPDGRIVRTSASTANDGIYVVDTRNNVNVCDNKYARYYLDCRAVSARRYLRIQRPVPGWCRHADARLHRH